MEQLRYGGAFWDNMGGNGSNDTSGMMSLSQRSHCQIYCRVLAAN